ncbi:MAG: triose-phosphate isomerase [Holosporaceae bacterium]|jgi:triosephosphate isomerase|nr:triose-phosphate isomerase [Holosporaceae bacterium]
MKTIVANWKMNGDIAFAKRFMEEINPINTSNTVIVCPPVGLIERFREFRYHVGAQNCFRERKGAFTGENSPQLLREIGCQYVIVGHSERRAIFHETDAIIYEKWEASIAEDLIPIVCVGEKSNDRENRQKVLYDQLEKFVAAPSSALRRTLFAYEPVWSIGTGQTPAIAEIENSVALIRDILGFYESDRSLLYGGSVNAENAATILACKNVNGLLIGGASLKIDEFKKIIQL